MNRNTARKGKTDRTAAGAAVLFLFAAVALSRFFFTWVIGAEGSGCLTFPLELYAIVLVIAGQGIAGTLSSLIRSRMARGQLKSAHRLMQAVMGMSLGAGLFFTAAVMLGADFLSGKLFSIGGSRMALFLIGPSFLLTMVTAVLRGYFQGVRFARISRHSCILQAILVPAAGCAGGVLLSGYGKKVAALLQNETYLAAYQAAGVCAGISIASLLCLLHLVVVYLLTRPVLARRRAENDRQYNVESASALLGTFSGSFLPAFMTLLFQSLPILILAQLLFAQGKEGAAESWGIFYGQVLPLVQGIALLDVIPFLGMVSQLGREWEKGSYQNYRSRIGMVLRLSAFLTAPAMLWLVANAECIAVAFGQSKGQGAMLLAAGSAGIFLMNLGILASLLLQKTGYPFTCGICAGAAFLVHLLLMLFLRGYMDDPAAAAAVSFLLFWLFDLVFMLAAGRKVFMLRFRWLGDLVRILLVSALASLPGFFLTTILQAAIGPWPTLCISLPVYVVIYVILAVFTGAADLYHMDRLPGGWMVLRVAQLFRLH